MTTTNAEFDDILSKSTNIKYEPDAVDIMFKNGDIEKTLDAGCCVETLYKARYYLTAAVITLVGCGIGLLLPFGAWACNYYKGLGF